MTGLDIPNGLSFTQMESGETGGSGCFGRCCDKTDASVCCLWLEAVNRRRTRPTHRECLLELWVAGMRCKEISMQLKASPDSLLHHLPGSQLQSTAYCSHCLGRTHQAPLQVLRSGAVSQGLCKKPDLVAQQVGGELGCPQECSSLPGLTVCENVAAAWSFAPPPHQTTSWQM